MPSDPKDAGGPPEPSRRRKWKLGTYLPDRTRAADTMVFTSWSPPLGISGHECLSDHVQYRTRKTSK
jgi:hypothetical protein